MNTSETFHPPGPVVLTLGFFLCLLALVGSVVLASFIQTDFGRVEVTNVSYRNVNGLGLRAKLFRPKTTNSQTLFPGILYAHGYQNNRETSDAYCLELARRGFVILEIDALGRGNSDQPNDPKGPNFDKTYGVFSSFQYLKTLPFVARNALGLMGHSLGAEWVYTVALKAPEVRALSISGFAYRMDATETNPKNMLMIIGKWDEFRKRMTGTRDIEKEWMHTPQSRKVIPVAAPRLNQTYGNFAQGTARKVVVLPITHIQESHNKAAITEALIWMKKALTPSDTYWIDPTWQIWPIKEWATLTAMLACFASLLFLGALLLRTTFFGTLQDIPSSAYVCEGKAFFRLTALNALLLWLYLPLIFVLFGIHVYVQPIDRLFPMMMVNGTVWWFFWINIIGFFLFRRWLKKQTPSGLSLADRGISYRREGFALDRKAVTKTILLGVILFSYAYFTEHLLEHLFIVDFRFWMPFASDLTPYRAKVGLLYFPFILIGFLGTGIFLHSQLRRPFQKTWWRTYFSWSLTNSFALITPLIFFLMIQYIPLFTTGTIPLVGPGGMFVTFILNLLHIILVLFMTIPISTWFFQLTGKIYLGALVNAALVTWMFVSSQVIAPIPV